jgi:hypothetical protein
VYYGGLVMARIRHFDPERERPGLPPGVAALVEGLDDESVQFRVANVGAEAQDIAVQAGAYAEHTFTSVERVDDGTTYDAGDSTIQLSLPANTEIAIDASIERFDNDPTYDFPWDR